MCINSRPLQTAGQREREREKERLVLVRVKMIDPQRGEPTGPVLESLEGPYNQYFDRLSIIFSSYRMHRVFFQLADKHKGKTSMLYPYLYDVSVVTRSTHLSNTLHDYLEFGFLDVIYGSCHISAFI